MSRRDQLAEGLAQVRTRIASAARAAGREPDAVRLVVVTKFWPASDVGLLAGLGVADVGESRDQEASAKVAECAGLDLRWHFVGQVQTNKAHSVATYADTVHSVDRGRLVEALSRGAAEAGREVGCLLQVSLDGDTSRGGALPDELPALADAVEAAPSLGLRGLMAVAPLGADPGEAFDRLAAAAQRLRMDHPAARWVSAGMSGDLEAAVAAGATHVRVGSAILGDRPPLR